MASDATCTKCDAKFYPTKSCNKECTGLNWTDGTKDVCTAITAAKAKTINNGTGAILTCTDTAFGPDNNGTACIEKCTAAANGKALIWNGTKCVCPSN